MKAYLLYESRTLPVPGERATLGRKLDNTIVLASKTVSRYHAEIILIDNDYFLRDLNSSSGTFLNERRIAHTVPIKTGDKILIAEIELEFIVSDVDLDTSSKQRTSPLRPSGPKK